MKKLLLSTVICVAFVSSAFASNEVIRTDLNIEKTNGKSVTKEDDFKDKPCKYKATVIDKEGRETTMEGTARDGAPIPAVDCGKYAANWVSNLEAQGYTILDYSSTWG